MRKPTVREVAYVGAGATALVLFYYRNDLASPTSMISTAGLTGLADQLASKRSKRGRSGGGPGASRDSRRCLTFNIAQYRT